MVISEASSTVQFSPQVSTDSGEWNSG